MFRTNNRMRRRFLIAALIGSIGFTAFHVVRVVNAAIYWHVHRDEPIEGWMTLGYVAHSYHVPPHILFLALGMAPGPPERRNIAAIAQSRRQSTAQVSAILDQAIVHARPPYPPPGPPPHPAAPHAAT